MRTMSESYLSRPACRLDGPFRGRAGGRDRYVTLASCIMEPPPSPSLWSRPPGVSRPADVPGTLDDLRAVVAADPGHLSAISASPMVTGAFLRRRSLTLQPEVSARGHCQARTWAARGGGVTAPPTPAAPLQRIHAGQTRASRVFHII